MLAQHSSEFETVEENPVIITNNDTCDISSTFINSVVYIEAETLEIAGLEKLEKVTNKFAFYVFLEQIDSFDANEIVIGALSRDKISLTVHSIISPSKPKIDVNARKLVNLTSSWFRGSGWKRINELKEFVQNLIKLDDIDHIDLAYKQVTAIEEVIPNPFRSRVGKLSLPPIETLLHSCARFGSGKLMSIMLQRKFGKFPLLHKSDEHINGESILTAALHWAANNDAFNSILDYLEKNCNEEQSLQYEGIKDRRFNFKNLPSTLKRKPVILTNNYKNIIDLQNDNRDSPLHIAIHKENYEALKRLLLFGADVKINDRFLNTPIHTAVILNDMEALTILQQSIEDKGQEGIDLCNELLNTPNRKGLLPTTLASSIPQVELLLKYIDFDAPETQNVLGNLFHSAAKHNRLELAEYLAKKGAALNIENFEGSTPLEYACVRGHMEVARLILERDKNPNYVSEKNGLCAINSAAMSGNIKIVHLLLEHEACLWDSNSMKSSALHSAVQGNQSYIITYLLQNYSMDPNIRDSNGKTPLYYAISNGLVDCVKALLNCKADPEFPVEKDTLTYPIDLAVNKNKHQILKILINFGITSDKADDNGITPLMLSTQGDKVYIMETLMQQRANIEYTDDQNRSIMHHIAINGAARCANFMLNVTLSNKARYLLSNQDNDNNTPIDIALKSENVGQELLIIFFQNVNTEYFNDNLKIFHHLLKDKEYPLLKSIFDNMWERKVVGKNKVQIVCTTFFLDSNEQGELPDSKSFTTQIPSLAHKLLDCDDPELKEHPIVMAFVNAKLGIYRPWFAFKLLFYLLFLFNLYYSLLMASDNCDVGLFDYDTNRGTERFRVLTDYIVFSYCIFFFLNEVLDFIIIWKDTYKRKVRSKYQLLINETDDTEIAIDKIKTNFKFLKNVVKSIANVKQILKNVDKISGYFFTSFLKYFRLNILDIASLICFGFYILLRIELNRYQWAFASLTLIIFTFNLFQHSSIIPSLGNYVQTIGKIFAYDIPLFSVVLVVILMAYVGGIHLAARLSEPVPGLSTLPDILNSGDPQECDNTSSTLFWFSEETTRGYSIIVPILSGLVLLLDGGPGNVEQDLVTLPNIYFTALYLIFAFIIIVVIANILIAQISETYAKIVNMNPFHYQLISLVDVEKKSNVSFFFGRIIRYFSYFKLIKLDGEKWQNILARGAESSLENRISIIEKILMNNLELQKLEREKVEEQRNNIEQLLENVGDLTTKLASLQGTIVLQPQKDSTIEEKLNKILDHLKIAS